MIKGATLFSGFVNHHRELFGMVRDTVHWDERMSSRKTASFGIPYNYSGITYTDMVMPDYLEDVGSSISNKLGFKPNNCLLNFYFDRLSRMGFHSDRTDVLQPGTGVAIISLGAERVIRFRKRSNAHQVEEFALTPGSLFYMSQEVQNHWEHAIPSCIGGGERISLTYRSLKVPTKTRAAKAFFIL